MKDKALREIEFSPGYSDMRGAKHFERLSKNKNGEWTIITSVREYFDAPTVTTTYEVSAEAVAQFEYFLKKAKIISLSKRRDSKEFLTDYSPWSFYIVFEGEYYGDGYNISQYKKYSKKDYRLLDKLREEFYNLRGQKISEITENDGRNPM